MRWRKQKTDSPEERPSLEERTLETIQSTTTSPPGPTVQELASIVAIVLVSDHSIDSLSERLKATSAETEQAIERLLRRGAVVDSGGGFFQSTQSACAGTCGRPGYTLGGQEVVIDSKTLSWQCASCRDTNPDPHGRPTMPAAPTATQRSLDSTLQSRAAAHADRPDHTQARH